jgi:hypothetical protein
MSGEHGRMVPCSKMGADSFLLRDNWTIEHKVHCPVISTGQHGRVASPQR